MGLREQVEADLVVSVEDPTGFGWDLVLTDPSGITLDLVGLSNDISLAIDPDTGQLVSGRKASVALRMTSLLDIGIPKGVANPDSKPWLVEFPDILGNYSKFKIAQAHPDRTIGLITCLLENYVE